jgi:voltage-gated sodium channel type V alpha
MGYVFNGIFIFDSILKIISRGFVMHKKAYLWDGWNILDFLIVIFAILEMSLIKYSYASRFFRSLRSFRPIKAINMIKPLKKLVKVLLISLPNLVNVLGLLTFAIFLFAILGLHSFNGALYFRCRTTETPISPT